MTIKDICDIETKCTGCSACAAACPTGAIRMTENREGFSVPTLSADICTQCGACAAVCPLTGKGGLQAAGEAYACQIKDKESLSFATAGGFFPLLAKRILEAGGVVYGCVWDADMKPVHKGITDPSLIASFSGSKYVQSDISGILKELYAHLQDGREVLFSGTPCQVDAVLHYCAELDLSRLITVDVICYGVPSPGLFSAYIDGLNRKYGARVVDFRFRDKKTYGWSHTTRITFEREDGSRFEIEEPDYSHIDYYKMFATRDCYRASCYRCPYNTIERVSDFTTGNYWGIENKSTAFDATLGVSMVLTNTERAGRILEEMMPDMTVEKRTVEDAIQSNDALVKGSTPPRKRDAIYACFAKKGFGPMFRKYYQPDLIKKCKAAIRRILRRGGAGR